MAGILPRPRLFTILDNSRKLPVTFVVSPAGSGKTSLVSSYASDRNIPCLWYSVDEGDKDIGTFFYYTEIALRKLFPKKRHLLPRYTAEHARGDLIFSHRYFEAIFSRINKPFMFVIDNYHEMPASSRFHAIIANVLRGVPEGFTFFILSRKDPPPAFARLIVHGLAHIIGWDALKFTVEETRELIEKEMPGGFPENVLRALFDKTNGWAAGLMLFLKSGDAESHNERLPVTVSSQNIFDYFGQEVFFKTDKNAQDFMLRTCFLPVMSIDTAAKLTRMKHAGTILDNLIRECCFIEEYSHEKILKGSTFYRYHQLFREFLLSMAKSAFDPATLSMIKHDSAMLLEESEHAEDAVRLIHESGDVKSLISIILKWAPSLIRQGRYGTLQNWLLLIPEEAIPADPWLLYWSGVSKLPFDPDESQRYFEKALYDFQESHEAAGSFLAWAGLVESIVLGRESLKSLDQLVKEVERMIQQYGGFPSEDTEVEVVLSVFKILTLRRPPYIDAEKWVNCIRTITDRSSEEYQKIRMLTAEASYLYSSGEFGGLQIALETLQGMIQRYDVPPLTILTVNWLRAALFNVMSMYEQCGNVVGEGLELARSLKIRVMEHMLLGHGIISSLKSGNIPQAKRFLQKMVSASGLMKPWEKSFYHYCVAWAALYQGSLPQASTHAEECLRLCEDIGNPWTLSVAYILKAYLADAFGENKQAFKNLSRARTIGLQSNNEFVPFICLLTEAYFYLRKGKEVPALQAIRKGMKKGREKGFMNLFMSEPRVLETVLTKALEHGIEEKYIKTLIRRNTIPPPDTLAVDERWPWPLKIYTLGRFGLVKQGSPVQFRGRAHQKPLLLLKAVIACGGKGVSEDRLIDVLWPDAYGDAAHITFKTTLSRLRDLIDSEKALIVSDGKVTIDPRCCWVDAWLLQRILNRLESVWTGGITGEIKLNIMSLSQELLKLYAGHFLADDGEPWVVSFREHLRNRFLRNIEMAGLFSEKRGEVQSAISLFRKGIEVDDLAENFYQRLMACYQRMGRKAEALAVYNRCRKTFSAVLGIEPSPETEALRAEILKS